MTGSSVVEALACIAFRHEYPQMSGNVRTGLPDQDAIALDVCAAVGGRSIGECEGSVTEEKSPVGWFGVQPHFWAQSPEREASIALWKLNRREATGFTTDALSDAHLICVHLSGTMNWAAKLDDRRYCAPCDAGTFCIARAGERGDIEHADADISFVHFYLPVRWFESDYVDAATARCADKIELVDPMNARFPRVAAVGRRAVAAMRTGGRAGRLQVDAAMLDLAATLVADHSTATPRAVARGGLSPVHLRRVVDYIAAHLPEAISLSELAALVGLSGPHFCRAFAASTGMPPHRYLTAARIERACELLRDPHRSIGQVGAEVGYDDPAHFSRVFGRMAGVPPRIWREASGHKAPVDLTDPSRSVD